MRCTVPPAAETVLEAGGPRGPKHAGGRPLPRRRAGDGDDGGEKYSSLELDATAALGDAGAGAGGCEAELSDEPGGVGCAARVLALVNILHGALFVYLL